MQLEKFNEQKAKFHEQEKAVLAIQTELDKAKNILEALKNEKAEFVARQKEKLAEVGTLSADEYVELKNKNSGLDARIEYYQAILVDLENKLYDEKEEMFSIQAEAKRIRSHIFIEQAEQLFSEIMEENQAKLAEIWACLEHSGTINPTQYTGNATQSDLILHHLVEKFKSAMPKEGNISEEYKLYSSTLTGFTPKSPLAKQKEDRMEKPKGLSALINEM
ncbi:hypothetical protein PTQ27_01225 [Mannheimia sp. AT1]|uniref:Uncharacterized protein n=1 Tax=Mannheimia cairinae TaxID=3025936 RepID=A0ABT5MLM1_9PAST|nr:hypothetical protein [Mannheimia cairinae]MDD0823095.1 hypothetical protein [Mannheimia cairinae]MDD0825880.1 hypothetical protein [Mannheimia cairinae]